MLVYPEANLLTHYNRKRICEGIDVDEGLKRRGGRCPLSGIQCEECGYPNNSCPIYLIGEALQDIARALENE